jgi:hypothetical protein
MRNIEDVLKEIIGLIPQTEENKDIIFDLNKVIKDSWFTAPEVMSIRWNQAYNFIMNYLFENREYIKEDRIDLGIRILSIFSGNSEEDIRKDCVKAN